MDMEFTRRLVEITRSNMTDEEKENERIFDITCNVFDNEIGAYGRQMHPQDFLKLSKEEQDSMIITQWDDCMVELELVEKVRQLLIAEFI